MKYRRNRRKFSLASLFLTAALCLGGCSPAESASEILNSALGEISGIFGEIRGGEESGSGSAGEEEAEAGEPDHSEEEPLEAESVSDGLYAYGTLDEAEQEVYDEIFYALENREESVLLATTDTEVLETAYAAVRCDYCGLFWSDSYQYELYSDPSGDPTRLYFQPIYTVTEEEQQEYQEQIDAEAERMLEGISEDASDFDKVCYVYRVLVEETDYSLEAENSQNIISTFIHHETVCQGYSYGAQYLLEKLGISCTTVTGTSQGESHSWNLVVMDGDYYYMDVTWGEVSYWNVSEEDSGEGSGGDSEDVNFSYLGVSDADTAFMEDHQAAEEIPMPDCTATADNYYVHENLYFAEWDLETVGSRIREVYDSGAGEICLKFGSDETYAQAYESLITQGNWQRYCNSKQIAYVDQFAENVLRIEFQ